jgi:hypothetical protein
MPTHRIVSALLWAKAQGQSSVDCFFERGDFGIGYHVLQSGRLGFTEGPPIAVK